MDEDERWQELIRSIKKGAKILGIDLTEADMPEYLNWWNARKMHENLWNIIYIKNLRV